jgi:Na+/H+ antiporter NhaD/arsenite permease-like protein
VLMMIASISSALVGEVTAILFMAGAMLHLTGKYKLNPIPFIIMLVFACNNGSAMSSVGNPIGVLIALKTGLGFTDFLKWAAPVALVVNVVVFLICRWWFADAFNAFAEAVRQEFAARTRGVAVRVGDAVAVGAEGGSGVIGAGSETDPEYLAESAGIGGEENALTGSFYDPQQADSMDDLDARKTYLLSWVVLLGLIVLLVTHKQTETLLGHLFHAELINPDGSIARAADGSAMYGLREGTMMVGAALIMGSVVLFIRRNNARELVERRVDWWTLSFFMMLFASVGTLEDTKVTEVIAVKLGGMGGNQTAVIQVIGWATGWLSAFLDNVLAVATFMPVVHDVRVKAGVPYSSAVYWFMLFGGTFMGNMTIIGSTANIVAVGLLEKRGHGTIAFGYWMKIGFLVAIASMLVATAMLALQWKWIPTLLPPVGGG